MSPQSNSTPGLSLPQPTLAASGQMQAAPDPGMPQPQAPPQVQQVMSAPAPAVAPPMPMPVPQNLTPAPMTPMPSQQPTQAAVAMPVPGVAPEPAVLTPPTPPEELDDEALDEEWVNKAKSIVEQNQADPFMESKALNRVKADYLQRRYGKQIKVNE